MSYLPLRLCLIMCAVLISPEHHDRKCAPLPQDSLDHSSIRVVAKPGVATPTYLLQVSITEIYIKQPKVTVLIAAMHHIGPKSYYAAVGRRLGTADVCLQEGYPKDEIHKLPEVVSLRARRVAASARLLNAETQPNLLPFMEKEKVILTDLPIEDLNAEMTKMPKGDMDELLARVTKLERAVELDPKHPDRVSIQKQIGQSIFANVIELMKGSVATSDDGVEFLKKRALHFYGKLKEQVDLAKHGTIGLIIGAYYSPTLTAALSKDYDCSVVVSWLDVISN